MIDHQPTTCQKFYRQQGARRPGDIISYRRATSSRNQRATSSESAPGLHHLTPPHSTGPSPSGWSFGPTSVAARWWRSGTFCSDPVREYLAPIRLLAPHRPEFRLRLYPHLPLTGFRLGFAFPVARPFVCECRNIPAIPCLRTIPGLPESLTFFPTVSPAHTLVRRSGTHAPSSP